MKRSIFKIIDPLSKPEPAVKRSRKKPPSFAVAHRRLGEGQLVGLRLGESGIWLADVKFDGARRTLQVQAEHWVTAISDILKLLPHFPPPKPEKATPANDDESADSEAGDAEDSVLDSGDAEEDGETELELGEQRIEEGEEDEVEAEEIGAFA
jgi:hypothetical protein